MAAFSHTPVLLEQCIQALALKEGATYVDCTLGGGGHSREILERTQSARLIGVDKDEEALTAAGDVLKGFGERVKLVKSDFSDITAILSEAGVQSVDGVLMDLGVSSWQLDSFQRGFSYRAEDAPLDMRMDRSQALNAHDVVNSYPQERIAKLLREYGEEKFAGRIASNIVRARQAAPLETCGELVKLIYDSIPAPARRTGGHPAKRTFQAIRIEVNGELEMLERAVSGWVQALSPGGRIAVITFHSLEDRIVKHTLRRLESPCICDPRSPLCTCGKKPQIKILTKKPIEADEQELKSNSRSQSAKLRAAERI